MLLSVAWFVCTALISSGYQAQSAPIQFVAVPNANQDSVIYLTNVVSYATLDASSAASRTVYFAKRSTYVEQTFTFSCIVNTQSSPLKDISLCCRKSRNVLDVQCSHIPFATPHGTINCAGTEYNYDADELRGANFSIRFKQEQIFKDSVDGLFRCHVTDHSKTTIVSNEVEVRDAVYYIRQLSPKFGNSIAIIPPLKRTEFPKPLFCVDETSRNWPNWMDTLSEEIGTILWVYCDIVSPINPHTCLQKGKPIPKDLAISYKNGTLYLVDPSILSKRNLAIVCRGEDVNAAVRTFAGAEDPRVPHIITKGLSVDETSTFVKNLQPLSDLYQNFTIIYGSSLKGFSLNALYREPEGGCSFEWSKDNTVVPFSGVSKFAYQLPIMDEFLLEGTYRLKVVSRSNPHDVLIFTFVVQVVRPPFFTEPHCLSRLYYVMKGNNFTTSCPFLSKPSPETYVAVNHYEASTAWDLRHQLEKEAHLNNKLSQLDISFQVRSELTYPRLFVLVNSLQLEQDFDLSLRLASPFGGSRIFGSMKVVPSPRLRIPPDESNCVENCDATPFNVSCVLEPELVQMWRQVFDITPSISWVVQNQWSSDRFDSDGIGRYFSIPVSDNSVISVWPHGKFTPNLNNAGDSFSSANFTPSPDSVNGKSLKDYLKENTGSYVTDLSLRCRIYLFVHSPEPHFAPPPGILLRRSRRQIQSSLATPNGPRLLYDSTWEPDLTLSMQLVALRSFSMDPQPVQANLTWIIAIVIAVLVVLIVIALGVWLYTRDRGETYMLYDKEKAHGNDPIQEMKETEGFKTYQRQEEQPIASSRYSINDDSMHMGSDEDGELEPYAGERPQAGSGYRPVPTVDNDEIIVQHAERPGK